MIALVLAIVVVLCPVRASSGSGCSRTELDSLRAALVRCESKIGVLRGNLARFNEELEHMGRDMDEARRAVRKGSLVGRYRLARLMRKSREKALFMDSLTREENLLVREEQRHKLLLARCYRALIREGWRRVAKLVEQGRVDEVRASVEQLRMWEADYATLREGEVVGRYPRMDEVMQVSKSASPREAEMLLRLMADMEDKARRDSVRIIGELAELEETIAIKKDLLVLIGRSKGTGVEGSVAFDEFEEKELSYEVQRLMERRATLQVRLERAGQAAAYYRRNATLLAREAGQK